MAVPSTAQILRDAADILARNGRHIGDYYDIDQADEKHLSASKCRVCAYGAIGLAAGVDLTQAELEEPTTPAEKAATEAAWTLAVYLGLFNDPNPHPEDLPARLIRVIGGWNDLKQTSDARVLAALRAAADDLEAEDRRDGRR